MVGCNAPYRRLADMRPTDKAGEKWKIHPSRACYSNDLVGLRQSSGGTARPRGPGRLPVDDQLDFFRYLNGQIGGFYAGEHPPCTDDGAAAQHGKEESAR